MDEDRDPFLEDEGSKGVDAQDVHFVDAENKFRENSTSPILNCTGSGTSSSHAGRRKGRIRRSGLNFPEASFSVPVDPIMESLKMPSSKTVEALSLSQELQPDFIAPITPISSRLPLESCSPPPCASYDVHSDEDIFASPVSDEQVNPSALNALFDGPEPADLSWSMVTPSANQSNTSWSNLNTEERKVLLPSDGSSLMVKPRALFSPDMNETADSHSLNMSLDGEDQHALKGQKAEKTPNYRRRKNSLVPDLPVESPLATCIAAEGSFYATPVHKTGQICLEASTGSPILSGSNEFSKSPNNDKGEEDLFGNEEECLVDILSHSQTSIPQDSKIAESTPHAESRKKIHSYEGSGTPPRNDPNNGELFLQDISVTALEEVCQAQELKDQAPLSTPEKQSETKRKRLLFSSNFSASGHNIGTFKTPEVKYQEDDKKSLQDNDNGHCIPDDSFMDHLAAMNTSIFSDNMQPVTKVQSIKSSLSKMKKFCYSSDEIIEQNNAKILNASEPKTLMKEILNSVMVLENTPAVPAKTKLIKSSGDLIVFSQLQEGMNKDLCGVSLGIGESSLMKHALRENEPSTNVISLLSPCIGFQTGSGKQVDMSQEALSKGFNLLKDCIEDADSIKLPNKIAHPIAPPISSSVPAAAEVKRTETNASDDLAAEEIKQLLQLVSDGEDFNPWHETEEISVKSAEVENPISQMSSKKCGNITNLNNKNGEGNLDSFAEGFATAGGKSIYVSDENLARAEKLLLEPETINSVNTNEKLMSSQNEGEGKNNTNLNERGGKLELNEILKIPSADDVSGSINRKRRLGKAPNAGGFIVPKKKTCLGIADTLSPSNQNSNSTVNPKPSKPQRDVPCVSDTKTETIDKPLVNISQDALNVVNRLIFNSSSKRKDPPSTSRSLVGFTTASGGTVNVSQKALDKVKNLFDDMPAEFEDESCEKKSAEISTCAIKEEHLQTDPAILNSATKPQKEISLTRSVSDHVVELSMQFVGFSTAGGKKVDITEEALKQVKNLFDDVAEPDLKIESKASIPKIRKSLGSFSKHGVQSSTNKVQTPVLPVIDTKIRGGDFSAASGMKALESEEAMSKVKQVSDDIQNDLARAHSNASVRKVRRSLGSSSKQGMQSVPSSIDSKTVNVSFSTATGISVSVSQETLSKVKNMFQDLPNEPVVDLPSEYSNSESTLAKKPSIDIKGFSTAGGRAVQISEDALNRARNLFDDLPSDSSDTDTKFNSAKDMAGFLTAGGRAVQVSEEALNRARNMFDDLPSERLGNGAKSSSTEKSSVDMTGLSITGGKEVQMFAEALNSAQNVFVDIPISDTDVKAKKAFVEMAGFSTAGGKAVQISEDALKKAKNIFDNLPSEPSDTEGKFSSAKKPPEDMAVFSTAGGRAVPVSNEALNKARNLFDECPADSSCSYKKSRAPMKPSVAMAGFSTAGGRAVQISKEALHKARNFFDDLPSNSSSSDAKSKTPMKPSVDMAGFLTAGGRSVQISKDALNRARNLFDDLPSESLETDTKSNSVKMPCKNMAGFSTAGGGAVQISEEALNKARNLFGNLPSDSSSKKPSADMSGFSTAGGRAVQISEEAIKKARNLFDEPLSASVNINTVDDSGVFTSCNDSHIDSHRFKGGSSLSANKENNFLSSALCQTNYGEIQKSSLTQEITESTAAILADDGFDLTVSQTPQETISTSPSMVTDRSSRLKPILCSASDDKFIPNEPTSPILSRSSNTATRKRPRRGRLSLSSNTGTKTSPTLGNRSASSSQHHQRGRLSLPSTVISIGIPSLHPDEICENSKAEVSERSCLEDAAGETNSTNNMKQSSKLPPSRKLFDSDSDLSPAKLNTPNTKINVNGLSKIESNVSTSVTPDHKSIPISRPHQNPLIRKALTKSITNQSSGFKTPYKSSSKDQQKRSPSSPLQNPPEAKRMKPSTNLYVSHVYFPLPGSEKINPRDLRPEVAEMRRRVAEEQKQVVDNYAEHKGELLRPCVGSWLAQKRNGKLTKISAVGTPANCSPSELLRNGVRSSIMSITAANAANFRFSAWEYYSEDVCRENVAGIPVGDGALLVLDAQGFIGIEEFQRAFLASPGVDPSLVPPGWIKNHYRWLVWKLAALECRFPCQLGGQCFSPHILMLQLKYRYDREIDRCERPALRRIFEHDDSAAKRMVLCVANILYGDEASSGLELELTDGWYSVTTSIDQDMQYRVKKGTITIGTKLIMHNAELMNCTEGCFPLQVRDDVRLKLCSNSTRRARWYAKLGFQDNPGPIKVPLSSILSSGGLVSCVTAYVARVYPLVFMEKTAERTVVRSQRAESKEVAKSERRREQLADKVYSEVQAELQQEQTKQKCSAKKFALKHVASLTTGEELCDILENASDPLSIQSALTEEQKQIVSNYQRTKQEELRSELESRVRLRLSDNANHARQVTPILKVRLFDEVNGNQCGAILSVWRPSEDMTSMFKEGQKLAIFSAAANGVRCGELQLSANRSTRYNCDSTSDMNPDLIRNVCPLTSLSLQGFLPRFGEIDIVGIVIRIGPAPQTSENPSHFQTVYLSDGQQNIIAILFWGGMKEFGMDDLIVSRCFIAASNLQCRGSPVVKAVPCVYASELSFFTTNPRQQYLQTAQQELRRSISVDLKTFCLACEDKLDDLLSQKIPCLKTPDSKPEVSKPVDENCVKLSVPNENSSSINSLASVKAQRKLSMEEQLRTPSPNNTRSPALEKRLASLDRYGDAVQISPIFISQPRRSLRQDFKAPRRTDSPSMECRKD